MYRNKTIADYAKIRAEESPYAVAFQFDNGGQLNFIECYEEALTLASALKLLGCVPGDVICFQLPNWREAIAIDIAASILGVIVCPIISIYRAKEVEYILKDTQAKVLLIPDSFRNFDFPSMIQGLLPKLTHLDEVVVVGGNDERSDGFRTYKSILEAADKDYSPSQNVKADDTKILLYTSGTTGNPKAVKHSHNTFSRAFDNGADAWGLNEEDVMLMPSPVTHITGFANGIELPFLSRATTAFMEKWKVDIAIDFINKVGATCCLSATPFLQELVSRCRERGETLPTMRFFASGGASVPPELIYDTHEVLERCRAFRVYGSTEAPLISSGFIKPEEEKLAAETDGKVWAWEVRIVSDHGRVLDTGQDGEILVKGPALMQGYRNNLQTESAITNDGFFRTGDIGHLTKDNAIVITDRKKDIIIRGGENLSAREIEDEIFKHPDVKQVAVVASPHPRLGEVVCAFLVLNNNVSLNISELCQRLSDGGLAKQKWPERIEVVDALPTTASGKIRKDKLRDKIKSMSSENN